MKTPTAGERPCYEIDDSSSDAIRRSITAIAAIERKAMEERSNSERLGDWVNFQAGRIGFIAFHVLWFAAWIIANDWTGPRFDPFPFPLLTLVVSLEAIFLSLFILISQNRTGRHADRGAQLDLQVNLLTEAEITKLMSMVSAICKAQNLPEGDDEELPDLARATEPQRVVEDLRKALDEES